jgi:hypothetical protein
MFFLIISRVMALFGLLIKDETTLLSKADQVGLLESRYILQN